MTRYSVSPRGSDRSMVGLNRPFADQFRTTSFMHCSSSTAGTSVRLTRSWAGCPDRVVVSGLSPDGEVFLLTSPFIDRYVGNVHSNIRVGRRNLTASKSHVCCPCHQWTFYYPRVVCAHAESVPTRSAVEVIRRP